MERRIVAVVFGVHEYPELRRSLPGVVNDVQRVLQALSRLGVSSTDVRLVTDAHVDSGEIEAQPATLEALEAALTWLASEPATESLFYAACGGFVRGADEFLAPSDVGAGYERGLAVRSIYERLAGVTKAVVALDTSFRGSPVGSRSLGSSQAGCSLFGRSAAPRPFSRPANAFEMRAATPAEARPDDIEGVSLIIERAPTGTWREARRDQGEVPLQEPVIEVSPNINHFALFSKANQPIGLFVPFPLSKTFSGGMSLDYQPMKDYFAFSTPPGAWPVYFIARVMDEDPIPALSGDFAWSVYDDSLYANPGVPDPTVDTWAIYFTLENPEAPPLAQGLDGLQGWMQREGTQIRLYAREQVSRQRPAEGRR